MENILGINDRVFLGFEGYSESTSREAFKLEIRNAAIIRLRGSCLNSEFGIRNSLTTSR